MRKNAVRVIHGPEIDDRLFYCLTNRFFCKRLGQEEMHMNQLSTFYKLGVVCTLFSVLKGRSVLAIAFEQSI